jgi:hypothetical protein
MATHYARQTVIYEKVFPAFILSALFAWGFRNCIRRSGRLSGTLSTSPTGTQALGGFYLDRSDDLAHMQCGSCYWIVGSLSAPCSADRC